MGLDNIDLPAARARGIIVSAAFGAVHDSVADLTLALLLAVARGIVPAHTTTRAGQWKGFMGVELRDKVLGIVGLGRIGKEVSLRAIGFGMSVVAHDPKPDPVFAATNGIRFLGLDELLSVSDVVSLHAGLEQAGRPLIGEPEIALMKDGAILVNTGRGHLVDEAALTRALSSGKLFGAGLDVYQEEPPKGSPLLGGANVVLAPHMAGDTREARRRMGEITVENVDPGEAGRASSLPRGIAHEEDAGRHHRGGILGALPACRVAGNRGTEPVSITSRTQARAEALSAEFGIPNVYSTPQEMVKGAALDVVDVISPPDAHEEHVLLAASRGLPVICQKPMAPSLEAAERMVQACRRAGVPYFVHENWRWQTPIRALKDELDEGSIGRPFRGTINMISGFPVFQNQPFFKTLRRFLLADQGSHQLDVARFLFGEATGVYCQTRRVHPDILGEDVATVMLSMESGATVVVALGFAENFLEEDHHPQTYVFVEGDKGSAELGPDYWVRVTTSEDTRSKRHLPPRYPWVDPEYEAAQAGIVPCLVNLLAGLRGDKAAETTGEDNLRTVRLVNAAYESADRAGRADRVGGHMLPINVWRHGRDEEPPPRRDLRAGPLTAVLDQGELRSICLGERELVNRIYAAVRDRNWETAPPVISDLKVDAGSDSFRATFDVDCTLREIHFTWKGTITGAADGSIVFSMDGIARSTFLRNRIGFCILHPDSCARARCILSHSDRSTKRTMFPAHISPHQPFVDLTGISHEVALGTWVELRFEGDLFETEDQRNWTDASYKTYCTPLALPFPAKVESGTVITQTVTLRLKTESAVGAGPAQGRRHVDAHR